MRPLLAALAIFLAVLLAAAPARAGALDDQLAIHAYLWGNDDATLSDDDVIDRPMLNTIEHSAVTLLTVEVKGAHFDGDKRTLTVVVTDGKKRILARTVRLASYVKDDDLEAVVVPFLLYDVGGDPLDVVATLRGGRHLIQIARTLDFGTGE